MKHRWLRAFAVLLFGVGLMLGPASVAHADNCRCAPADSREFAVPADPPFTLPYERPDGPGTGIYGIDW